MQLGVREVAELLNVPEKIVHRWLREGNCRHADGLLVTGPVTENMKLALEKTYAAVPSPRIVIASGCPPHPLTLLEALLEFQGRRTGS